MVRVVQYCTKNDVADWLRIDINANTDPSTSMVEEFIMMNEDDIDHKTGHSWRTDKVYTTDTFDVNEVYHYGHGMYIPLKHRNIKDWDEAQGDLFEIWNGISWVPQTISTPTDSFVNFEPTKGILYIRGYIYTILRNARFRLTYRYGGSKEHTGVPKDIKKACVLMTAIDILSTDFKMSQIAYGGEGNISKDKMIEKWQAWIDKKMWEHSEIPVIH